MIVGTKRDRYMCPQSLADVGNCGFDYIGSLCAKTDNNYDRLPEVDIAGFCAKKFGNVYYIHFWHDPNEPGWAHGEHNILNIDIFVERKR